MVMVSETRTHRQAMAEESELGPVPRAIALGAWSAYPWESGLQIERLQPLDEIVVHTKNSRYEITLLAPQCGEVLVRGGSFFPEFTRARLAGATLGGSFLKQYGIYVGFRLEIVARGRPVITTPVQSVAAGGDSRAH
jgi:hypothetical protein